MKAESNSLKMWKRFR